MAKTKETLELEKAIYSLTHKMGVFGCFEVTIGWFGKERVDYMTYDTKGIFRCYEIKVSKADFHSKAKHTFLGHFNYYVMPTELYEQVKDEIPSHIGVYNSERCLKNPKKQEVEEPQLLKDSMIRSLSRYLENELKSNNTEYLRRLKNESDRYRRERDDYYMRYCDLRRKTIEKYGRNWDKEDKDENI